MYRISSPIIPAVIPQSRTDLCTLAEQITFTTELHLDVVDGQFVPFTSWPYEPYDEPQSVKSVLDRFSLEVDLMVADPLPAADAWLAAGADMLIFHTETLSLAALDAFRATTAVTIGVSALNDTPLETLLEYAAFADYVQVMGIAAIGSQGQPFDTRALERITAIREAAPHLGISIDGSVNTDTIAAIRKVRVDRYIVGSGIVKQPDMAAAHHALTTLVS